LFYWAFKHAPLLRVPLCVSWTFLVYSRRKSAVWCSVTWLTCYVTLRQACSISSAKDSFTR